MWHKNTSDSYLPISPSISTCLFLGDIWPESQASFNRSQFEVVWGNIQWWEEVCLCLPMTHTPSLPHLPCMHMAWDGRDFRIGWGEEGGGRKEDGGGRKDVGGQRGGRVCK